MLSATLKQGLGDYGIGAKIRGLRVALTAGTAKGEGLMRRLDVSRDPVAMLDAALQEAAAAAGVQLTIEDGAIYLTR
jgi:hypothetical protein